MGYSLDRLHEDAADAGRDAPMNVLLGYGYVPHAVPSYLEAELRKAHRVITCGPSFGRPQDIPCTRSAHMSEILGRLPDDFEPDAFLWIHSPCVFLPDGVETVPCPTGHYQTASQWEAFWSAPYARAFDHVFVTPKAVAMYRDAGNEHVHGILNACAPEMAAPPEADRPYDVAFLGTVNSVMYPERAQYLARTVAVALADGLRLFVANGLPPERLREVYGATKVVFNASFQGGGANMRVFEALACGAALLTDDLDTGSEPCGLRDDVHVRIYDDARYEAQLRALLADPAGRVAMARRGQAEGLSRHCYPLRVAAMLAALGSGVGGGAGRNLPPAAERHLAMAIAYYVFTMYPEAQKHLDSLESAAPDHPDLALARAVVAAATGASDAEARLRAAPDLLGRLACARWLLGHGRVAEAAAIAESLPIAPHEVAGERWSRIYFPVTIDWPRMEWLALATSEPAVGRARFLRNQALAIRAQAAGGDPAAELPLLEALTASRPGDPDSWMRRGKVAAELGRRDEAIACYDRALRDDPFFLPARLLQALELLGDDASRADLLRARRLLAFNVHLGRIAMQVKPTEVDRQTLLRTEPVLAEIDARLGKPILDTTCSNRWLVAPDADLAEAVERFLRGDRPDTALVVAVAPGAAPRAGDAIGAVLEKLDIADPESIPDILVLETPEDELPGLFTAATAVFAAGAGGRALAAAVGLPHYAYEVMG